MFLFIMLFNKEQRPESIPGDCFSTIELILVDSIIEIRDFRRTFYTVDSLHVNDLSTNIVRRENKHAILRILRYQFA